MVFFDPKKRQEAENLLSALNIDSGRMYLKPLHMIFDIGYEKNPELFPNAKMVADGLLTIPAHPYLRTKDINNIINALQRIK